MTFSCKNYDLDGDRCNKLKSECIPGRPGCVLEGKVKVSKELARKIEKLKNQKHSI